MGLKVKTREKHLNLIGETRNLNYELNLLHENTLRISTEVGNMDGVLIKPLFKVVEIDIRTANFINPH